MVTVEADGHKRTHTSAAVDELGRKLAERTVASTSDGHLEALAWASQWPERRWALEDCRQMARRLEPDLLSAGEALVRVPTRLMAAERRGGRQRGKSDPIDALAVARAALREDDLPVAHLGGPGPGFSPHGIDEPLPSTEMLWSQLQRKYKSPTSRRHTPRS